MKDVYIIVECDKKLGIYYEFVEMCLNCIYIVCFQAL